MKAIDPVAYATTRNFGSGAVTYLSPYISRGVISTKQVFQHVMGLGLSWYRVEKLVQELAWRDYWQQVWIHQGDKIFKDLKQKQTPIESDQMPLAVLEANTGIEVVDGAIRTLYKTGYMHNHMRMYVASICCNIAGCHWSLPAQWLYYHLLDGDGASNTLSWQWVAGSFSKKKYYANQENINKYFSSSQRATFLDVGYDQFETLSVPSVLKDKVSLNIEDTLPIIKLPDLDPTQPTLIYTYHNLDYQWHTGEPFQRVLLLEPSFFQRFPVSKKCIDFVLYLSENIEGLKILVGEFESLLEFGFDEKLLRYKEHPTCVHFKGIQEPRYWMSTVEGYFPSFFSFWKKCKKELRSGNPDQLKLGL